MRGFFWTVAAGVSVVFIAKYISERSAQQTPETSTAAVVIDENESETWA